MLDISFPSIKEIVIPDVIKRAVYLILFVIKNRINGFSTESLVFLSNLIAFCGPNDFENYSAIY